MLDHKNKQNQEDCALLQEAGELAAKIALQYFSKDIKKWMKAGNSPVSEADLAVDKALQDFLLKRRPNYGWISEESEKKESTELSGRSFVIDPIDGTRGFLAKSPVWCISLAIIEKGQPVIGLLNCPCLEEVYWAIRDKGAYLNNHLLERRIENKKEKLFITAPKEIISFLPEEIKSNVIFRNRIPSLAYCLALFAKQELDILLTNKRCYDWDIAAADVILKEVGQDLYDMCGDTLSYGCEDYRHNFLCVGPEKYQNKLYAIMQNFSTSLRE